MQAVSYPDDWDPDDMRERTPEEVEQEAAEMLRRATVRLPEYSGWIADAELLRLTSALHRIGFTFYRAQGERAAQVIPTETVEIATAMQHEASLRKRAAATVRQDLSVAQYAQQLRADADLILAQHGVEIRARTMQKIAETEAA